MTSLYQIYLSPNFHILSPLWSFAIVCPIFIHSDDLIVFQLDEGGNVERSGAILGIYPCCGDNHIVRRDDLFDLAIPISGILAVGSYKFLNRELLIGAMPIHIGIGVEIFSYQYS